MNYPEDETQPASLVLTATVAGLPPQPSTRMVFFYDGPFLLGRAFVNAAGVASYTVVNPSAGGRGTYDLHALYTGDVTSISSTSNWVYLAVEDLTVQRAFAAALLAAARTYENAVVWEDGHTGSSGGGAGGGLPPAANPFLADKPTALSDAELTRLEVLVKTRLPNAADKAERDALMGRLKTAGVQFDGLDALQTLDRILKSGQRGLKGDPRKEFIKLYRDGLQVAIKGLQGITEAFYQLHKQTFDAAKAQNPDELEAAFAVAITSRRDGETMVRRYKLEQLINAAK